MKFTRNFFFLLFIVLLITACSKDGDVGPQGELGEQGIQGEQGPKGDIGNPGQDGATGTANVIYSEWLPSPFSKFDPDVFSSINARLIAPGLTLDIANNGAVLIYGRTSGSEVLALPVTLFSQNQSYHYNAYDSTTPTPEAIRIIVEAIDGGAIGEDWYFDEFRYVLIPGGIPASGKSASVAYSKMSYEEIAERFNIPD